MDGSDYHVAESEHRSETGSGVLRAGVFGMSDGLVSNLALVMGVAGGTADASAVVLAGSAGLMAGALSMAAGEYVSMATQRESMQRQLDVEREHIELYPDEERQQLAVLLTEAGLPPEASADVARRIHMRTGAALDFHALLELGIVPRQMGSPGAASFASFVAFALGAAIPLLPWMLLANAIWVSMLASGLALLILGGAVSRVTNRGAVWSALRQLALGAGAATVTWLISYFVTTGF